MQPTLGTEVIVDNPSLYDSQTVREVLARATQLEAQEKADLLDEMQIAALGEELGLSPDTVRRALGEVTGKNSETATVQKVGRRTARTTKEEAKAACVPVVWYLILSFPILFILTKMASRGGDVSMGLILFNTAVTLLLSLRFGYLTRSAKVGAIGGAFTVFLGPVLVTFLYSLTWRGYIYDRVGMLLFASIILGAIVGGLGAGMRNWWESLPSKNDR